MSSSSEVLLSSRFVDSGHRPGLPDRSIGCHWNTPGGSSHTRKTLWENDVCVFHHNADSSPFWHHSNLDRPITSLYSWPLIYYRGFKLLHKVLFPHSWSDRNEMFPWTGFYWLPWFYGFFSKLPNAIIFYDLFVCGSVFVMLILIYRAPWIKGFYRTSNQMFGLEHKAAPERMFLWCHLLLAVAAAQARYQPMNQSRSKSGGTEITDSSSLW